MANRPRPTSQQILSKIRSFEVYLNNLQMIPATRQYRNAVILALLSKALTVSRAICTLVDAGFPAEAFAMSRTVIEIYFNVRYISNRDTEARAKRYADYHSRVRQEWRTIIMKFYPEKPIAELQLDADVLEKAKEFKSKSQWIEETGGQAKFMALEEDPNELDAEGRPEKSEFDLALYFWTSHYVHATVVGTDAHATEPGQVFRIHARNFADVERGEDALFNVATSLGKMFSKALRAMNEEQPDAFTDLTKMVSEFAHGETAATP